MPDLKSILEIYGIGALAFGGLLYAAGYCIRKDRKELEYSQKKSIDETWVNYSHTIRD